MLRTTGFRSSTAHVMEKIIRTDQIHLFEKVIIRTDQILLSGRVIRDRMQIVWLRRGRVTIDDLGQKLLLF